MLNWEKHQQREVKRAAAIDVVLSKSDDFSSDAVLTCGSLHSHLRISRISNRSHLRITTRSLADQHKHQLPFSLAVDTLMDKVKWDDKGLVVAITQNVDTGSVLMQGFANRAALATTISSGKATFYSRSRSTLGTKGETSKNFINVHDILLDCDKDSIIYLGKADGPTCHTGSDTCYYTSVLDLLGHELVEQNNVLTTLYMLEATIAQRKAGSVSPQSGKPSWTKKLLLDDKLLCSKIREEANELCQTLEDNEDKSRAASEMADVLYHAMVLLALKNVKIEDVMEILRKRFSKSGIEEKHSRSSRS